MHHGGERLGPHVGHAGPGPTERGRAAARGSIGRGAVSWVGLGNPDAIRVFTGVRDDPFIFPKFFKRNAIVMVLSIPFSAFPAGQQDWLLWGTSAQVKDGAQIDHVGRSTNDKPFLASFPYLAEPWPAVASPVPASIGCAPRWRRSATSRSSPWTWSVRSAAPSWSCSGRWRSWV
jgi:hypothetical protein